MNVYALCVQHSGIMVHVSMTTEWGYLVYTMSRAEYGGLAPCPGDHGGTALIFQSAQYFQK